MNSDRAQDDQCCSVADFQGKGTSSRESAESAVLPKAPLTKQLARTIWREKGCPSIGSDAFLPLAEDTLQRARSGAVAIDEAES